jgi:hypothetical protein
MMGWLRLRRKVLTYRAGGALSTGKETLSPPPSNTPRKGSEKSDIVAINRKNRIVVDSDGNRGHISEFFDKYGDDCEPEDAVSCAAECAGVWYALDLSEFENVFSS